MITPLGEEANHYAAGFTLGYEKTKSGSLQFRFEVKASSGEWFNSSWFVPSTTDVDTLRWISCFWSAHESWWALMMQQGISPGTFFAGFKLRIREEDHIAYRLSGTVPSDVSPIDAAYLQWSISMVRVKKALRKLKRFDDLCLVEPRNERALKRYFAYRKGIVWESPIAFSDDQWKVLIDREIEDRGLLLQEECVPDEDDEGRVIPIAVQREVWRRDQGRCVRCGSNERLEFDHIIPFSMGGNNTARNIQLLCEKCNRAKGGQLA